MKKCFFYKPVKGQTFIDSLSDMASPIETLHKMFIVRYLGLVLIPAF